jgi:hypothetical protein
VISLTAGWLAVKKSPDFRDAMQHATSAFTRKQKRVRRTEIASTPAARRRRGLADSVAAGLFDHRSDRVDDHSRLVELDVVPALGCDHVAGFRH